MGTYLFPDSRKLHLRVGHTDHGLRRLTTLTDIVLSEERADFSLAIWLDSEVQLFRKTVSGVRSSFGSLFFYCF